MTGCASVSRLRCRVFGHSYPRRTWTAEYDVLCAYNTANNNSHQSWGKPAPKWGAEYVARMETIQADYNKNYIGKMACSRCGQR